MFSWRDFAVRNAGDGRLSLFYLADFDFSTFLCDLSTLSQQPNQDGDEVISQHESSCNQRMSVQARTRLVNLGNHTR